LLPIFIWIGSPCSPPPCVPLAPSAVARSSHPLSQKGSMGRKKNGCLRSARIKEMAREGGRKGAHERTDPLPSQPERERERESRRIEFLSLPLTVVPFRRSTMVFFPFSLTRYTGRKWQDSGRTKEKRREAGHRAPLPFSSFSRLPKQKTKGSVTPPRRSTRERTIDQRRRRKNRLSRPVPSLA